MCVAFLNLAVNIKCNHCIRQLFNFQVLLCNYVSPVSPLQLLDKHGGLQPNDFKL